MIMVNIMPIKQKISTSYHTLFLANDWVHEGLTFPLQVMYTYAQSDTNDYM